MNIVRINCGLGNQMFQYAFYRMLKEIDNNTKLDISEFKYRKHHNGYELESIFNINPCYATKKECDKIADISKSLFDEIRRDFLKIKKNSMGNLIYESNYSPHFNPILLQEKNTYFIGYWQTEKYFQPISKIIRKEFSFKKEIDPSNLLIKKQILNTNSVSIHIRRGDYLKKQRFENLGSVCNIDYYNRAIEQIKLKIESPHFFIFSDDMDWVKGNLKIPNLTYVDLNHGKDSYKDMQLMSLCKHNIITNSSFSWWGAWLNANPQKTVIAPNIWFRDVAMIDIIPETWTRLEV
ncbi:MAG: alpha-1,2-fucosyltransferase [Paludibacteraceae bacterium]|nr:alpha-1,2-fucosyltransferase [Paludibacteraceae bacterium]